MFMQLTLGCGGILWLYDAFRMPALVDGLLGRRRNERHKYRPSALLLLVVGFWCGMHNFYLFGARSRYAKLYGVSSLVSVQVLFTTNTSIVYTWYTRTCPDRSIFIFFWS